MCLKDRLHMIPDSIKSISTQDNLNDCAFVITEAVSENIVNPDTIKLDNLTHYVVDLDCDWSRGKLLNFGFKRSESDFVLGWDCDFRFDNQFLETLVPMLESSPSTVFKIACYETKDGSRNGMTFPYQESYYEFKKGDRYGSCWVYPRKLVESVLGFDEEFVGWGSEERDLLNRIMIFNKSTPLVEICRHLGDREDLEPHEFVNNYRFISSEHSCVSHETHSDESRHKIHDEMKANKYKSVSNIQNNISTPNKDWGNLTLIQE